jgi:hypothetical protein
MYGEKRGVYRVLVGKPEGRDHLEDPGIDETCLSIICGECALSTK